MVYTGAIDERHRVSQLSPDLDLIVIHHTLGFSIGHLVLSSSCKIRSASLFSSFFCSAFSQGELEVILLCPVSHINLTKFTEEERLLVRFFGSEYEDYRRRVGVMIPFIS